MAGPSANIRFYIKTGDDLPWLVCRLRESPNVPFVLTGVQSVRLTVQEINTGELVVQDADMELLDAADARYRYKWPFRWPRSGQFQAVVRVTWTNGQQRTLPTRGYVIITAEPNPAPW